ncbi:MAG: aminoglycoside 3'-phosphotransferase [Oscillospiraceae bacterium]|nr:aminoglycoside 3'-phosphotransferase [Oscillospiraceae bacterium]
MQKTPVLMALSEFPEQLHPFLRKAALYDSSSSPEARVWFVDKGEGFYLKKAAKGTLKDEAELTVYFKNKGLGVELLAYLSLKEDWMLTRAARGEDCTHAQYLAQPQRLCDTLATQLRALHEMSYDGCPVKNRTASYLQAVRQGYAAGNFDNRLVLFDGLPQNAEDSFAFAMQHAPLLKNDTFIHGDYCLPNVVLDNWQFSAFIDVTHGGVGERHIDLFWGIWSLAFNLNSTQYTQRFLDAYGRDRVDMLCLHAVACMERFG